MSDRNNTFTWTHLCCWIYQQNYLTGAMTFARMLHRTRKLASQAGKAAGSRVWVGALPNLES